MKAVLEVIKAWDKLEGGKHYSPKEIEEWLINELGPAIKELRHYHASQTEMPKLPSDNYIQKHIVLKTRTIDGIPAMDEQTFYEGAKWMREIVRKQLKGGK